MVAVDHWATPDSQALGVGEGAVRRVELAQLDRKCAAQAIGVEMEPPGDAAQKAELGGDCAAERVGVNIE